MNEQEFKDQLKAWLDQELPAPALTQRLLRAMFYGDFGAGKTTLMGQIVKANQWRTMLFYTDSNWVVLQNDPEVAELVDVKPFESFSQLRMFARANRQGIEPFSDYDCIIWDTISTGVYRTLRKLVAGLKFNDQRHPEIESWSHYNLVRAKMMETIEELNKSNLHILLAAHDQEPSSAEKGIGEGGGRINKKFAVRPNFPEATYKEIAREVSLLGWVFKEDEGAERQVTFEGTKFRAAKSQVPGIKEATYPISEVPELVRKWQTA